MKKTQFFYLSELHNPRTDSEIQAISIEETSFCKYDIQFVSFTIFGEQYRKEMIYVNRVRINKIVLDDKKLNIHYHHQFIEKVASLSFLSSNAPNLARYIGTLLLFIKNNASSVEQYGLREYMGHEHILSFISLKSLYEKVIQLKTHRLSSSVNRVGKDNDFYEDMVISYSNDKDFYFIKLLSDFMRATYDFDKKTMTVGMSTQSAWSPSYEPYITPDDFEYKRAEFIEYITKSFDYNEGCKYTLLNMPLK